MSQPTDLCTVASLKAWLTLETQAADPLLSRLVTATSRLIQNYCSRLFLTQATTLTLNGHGGTSLVLPDQPIILLNLVTVNGAIIPAAANSQQAGWLLVPCTSNNLDSAVQVVLNGYRFHRGLGNVVLTYTTGYQSLETWTIPATPFQVSVLNPWRADGSVTITGVTATAISAGTPTTGQYVPPSLSALLRPEQAEQYLYTFASADAGKVAALTYSYTPHAVEQACLETAARKYKERGRIGEQSKTLAGEVLSYDLSDLSEAVKLLLAPYDTKVLT